MRAPCSNLRAVDGVDVYLKCLAVPGGNINITNINQKENQQWLLFNSKERKEREQKQLAKERKEREQENKSHSLNINKNHILQKGQIIQKLLMVAC